MAINKTRAIRTKCFFSVFTCLIVVLPLTITSCAQNNVQTVNPFYSSFEDNDVPPLEDQFLTTPANMVDSSIHTRVTTGPQHGYGTKEDRGYSGLKSFEYGGKYDQENTLTSFSNVIYDQLNTIIGDNTEFSYKLFPDFADGTNDDLKHNLYYVGSYVSVDLLFNNDDTNNNLISLAATGIKDINGNGMTPFEQGEAKCLFSFQWNSVRVNLSPLKGKHVHEIVVSYQNTSPPDNTELSGDSATAHDIHGFIDDITIQDKPQIDASSPTNYVDTRRGTDGHMDWSRGSTFPATCLPHGFNFYTPVQHSRLESSGDADWLYNYKAYNDDNNLPYLSSFAISHEPAPWMHDYDQLQIMPQIGSVDATVNGRQLEYRHENETAHPDYYAVTFDNGIKTEITPSSHSAIFRFTYPISVSSGQIVLDSLLRTGQIFCRDHFAFDGNNIFGWVDNGAWNHDQSLDYHGGQTPMFFYGQINTSFEHHTTSGTAGVDRDYCQFNFANSRTIEFKIATSFIGIDQAKHNLDLEINNHHLTFDSLHKKATEIWRDKLNVLDISKSNATEEQKTIIYSNLYRLNMYPNESFENRDSESNPYYYHVSSVLPVSGSIGTDDVETKGQVREGKTYVNSGFWDTYRTLWPIYSILYPQFLDEMVNGFLFQYTEGGYVSRWSAPGYTDCMTGTSSDCAFADGYLNGTITNIDTVLKIYKSGLADALQYSPDSNTGRKGLDHSMFRGWTTSTDVSNGENMLDWDFQGWINDYAIGQLAIKLSNDPNLTDSYALIETSQTKQQIKDTGQYLLNRSNNYVNLFYNQPGTDENSDNGFFRSKDDNGDWYTHIDAFDARDWGYENVEANGWNFAFSAVYDVDGMVNLYGGQDKFIQKLDQFFSIRETGQHMGSIPSSWGVYSFTRETRDLQYGQCVMSNQPAHHIPYMYAAAGKPAKTQYLTRNMLHRMFTGSDIGQGYCGDEDNGEMSSWYILSMLGLYDLALGSNKYIVTSPMLNNVTIKRDNGLQITIKTDDQTQNNVYIKSATLDGSSFNDVSLTASSLLSGNHTLSYQMSNTPTQWGDRSITGGTKNSFDDLLLDKTLTTTDGIDIGNLDDIVDGDITTYLTTSGNSIAVQWQSQNPIKLIQMLSVSSYTTLSLNNLQVLGSNDGINWNDSIIDLNNVSWSNPFSTRVFSLNTNYNYAYYKIILSANAPFSISELAFMG